MFSGDIEVEYWLKMGLLGVTSSSLKQTHVILN